MSRTPVIATALTATVLTAGGLLAGLGVASTGAAAADSCTAWATLPRHVALGAHPVTVSMTLTGTSGCHAGGVDNGATATLRGPGASDPQQWSSFGARDTQTFQLRVNRLGTYTLRDGDVQVYNSDEERVPAHWRTTSVVIQRAGRIRDLHRQGRVVRGQVQSYDGDGWRGRAGARAVLQQQTSTGWRSVVQEKSSGTGRFVFSGVRPKATYRVVSTAAGSDAAAASRRV